MISTIVVGYLIGGIPDPYSRPPEADLPAVSEPLKEAGPAPEIEEKNKRTTMEEKGEDHREKLKKFEADK